VSISLDIGQVAVSLVLVAIAAAISLYQRAELEQDLGVAVVRSAIQLTAVGYLLDAIFDADSTWLAVALLAVMVLVGTFTARGRAKAVPRVFAPLLIALTCAVAGTVALVVALGIFDATPRYLVPVGGMVIGNSMTAAAVALNRLGDDVRRSERDIEALLALGATSTQAVAGVVRRSLRSAMIPIVDQTKTTGIIAFPGVMVGMLLGGAEALDAVKLQLVLLWTLMGAVAISALVAVTLAQRRFFSAAQQLLVGERL
jgi:putative ABC transport system permease protein